MFDPMFDPMFAQFSGASSPQETTKLKLEVVAARRESEQYRQRLNRTSELLTKANARIAQLESEKSTLLMTIESQTVIITKMEK